MWKFCLVYVDDSIMWSLTENEHLKRLKEVFQALNEVGFKLKLSKCEFFMKKAKYLGFEIEKGKIGMDPQKVEAIVNYGVPQTKKQLQRFLGMINWYSKWIPNKGSLTALFIDFLSLKSGE